MREHLEMLRHAVAAGEVSAVLVHSASRLWRNQPELLGEMEELDRHGVSVHFVKNRHGVRSWAISRFRQRSNALVTFVLSLIGHGNSNTARNRE